MNRTGREVIIDHYRVIEVGTIDGTKPLSPEDINKLEDLASQINGRVYIDGKSVFYLSHETPFVQHVKVELAPQINLPEYLKPIKGFIRTAASWLGYSPTVEVLVHKTGEDEYLARILHDDLLNKDLRVSIIADAIEHLYLTQ